MVPPSHYTQPICFLDKGCMFQRNAFRNTTMPSSLPRDRDVAALWRFSGIRLNGWCPSTSCWNWSIGPLSAPVVGHCWCGSVARIFWNERNPFFWLAAPVLQFQCSRQFLSFDQWDVHEDDIPEIDAILSMPDISESFQKYLHHPRNPSRNLEFPGIFPFCPQRPLKVQGFLWLFPATPQGTPIQIHSGVSLNFRKIPSSNRSKQSIF